jgi:hydrogenase maturation protease
VGVGNQLRSDDAAGLEVVTSLRSRLGPAPARGLKIHRCSPSAERLLAKLSEKPGRIIVFDAVEASKEPGEVVFCGIADTRYGFFATHNVPLRLIPGLAAREKDIYLVGIQPESMQVGEVLSDRVKRSVERVVATVTDGVKSRA